jgi:hypothetical protein
MKRSISTSMRIPPEKQSVGWLATYYSQEVIYSLFVRIVLYRGHLSGESNPPNNKGPMTGPCRGDPTVTTGADQETMHLQKEG